ncbi:MAG: hypothetical protein WAQ98_17590 [Blastocatellia bacterium]
MKKRLLIFAISAVVILCSIPIVGFFLLNSDWLKEKLTSKVKSSLEADLEITSLSFEPLKGKAHLLGIKLVRKKAESELDINIEKIDLELKVLPLLYRSINIEKLEISNPQVVTVVRSSEPKKGNKQDRKKQDFEIKELYIKNGSVDYTEHRINQIKTGVFNAKVLNIQYYAKNISPTSLSNLLYKANIQANIDIGTQATLNKAGTSTPATCALIGVDLAYINSFYGNEEQIKVVSGQMDLNYIIEEDSKTNFKVLLKDLKLDSNQPNKTLMYIPLETITKYLEKNNSAITLEFTVDESLELSEDINFFMSEFLKGLSKEIPKHLLETIKKDILVN